MNNQPQEIPLELIDPNPWQTRRVDLPGHVEELAHSIRKNNLMQIPIARRQGERFQLAFGHSRLAAFKLLNTLFLGEYPTMPLVIRELDNEQMAVMAFEENEKRKDLNPVEKALAIRKMIEDFGWTQQMVAEKVHVDRSTVSNMIRMLRMPEDVLMKIENGILPVRSAMALLAWYELTELELTAVHEHLGEDVEEFIALARNGEVNSDTIRARLDEYLGFLAPKQTGLDLNPTMTTEETPIVVEGELVEISDGVETRSISDEIAAIPDDDEVEGENFIERSESEAEEATTATTAPTVGTATTEINAAPTVGTATTEVSAAPTVEKATPAATAEPEPASQDTLFTIAWNTAGVFVGLRRPGKAPVVQFLATLTANEIPALMVELGIG